MSIMAFSWLSASYNETSELLVLVRQKHVESEEQKALQHHCNLYASQFMHRCSLPYLYHTYDHWPLKKSKQSDKRGTKSCQKDSSICAHQWRKSEVAKLSKLRLEPNLYSEIFQILEMKIQVCKCL